MIFCKYCKCPLEESASACRRIFCIGRGILQPGPHDALYKATNLLIKALASLEEAGEDKDLIKKIHDFLQAHSNGGVYHV